MAYQDSIPQAQADTLIAAFLASIEGYDAENASQVLTHTDGVLTWVTGLTDTIDAVDDPSITVVSGVVTASEVV